MSANVWLGSMVAASVLVLATASRSEIPHEPAPPVPRVEAPWLTTEAAAQIVRADGRLGPLFDGVTLGGAAPTAETSARIAAFARDHHIDLDLEVTDGTLTAVRLDVTYGGCCGYEGADVFARRIGRPEGEKCCGCTARWHDDWAAIAPDGTYLRGRVRFNRVRLRWEHALTTAQLLARVDAMVGADRDPVAARDGDRWSELEPNSRYVVELPFAFDSYVMTEAYQLGMEVAIGGGRITEATFSVRDTDDDAPSIAKALRAQWGAPSEKHGDTWTWRAHGHTIAAQLFPTGASITVRQAGTLNVSP